MKVLIGANDHDPSGFCHVNVGEILRLARPIDCMGPPSGSWSRVWVGTNSGKQCTLARVAETPACFELRPELAKDPLLLRANALASTYPVGTLLRCRYPVGVLPPGGNDDQAMKRFLDAWRVLVAGPN